MNRSPMRTVDWLVFVLFAIAFLVSARLAIAQQVYFSRGFTSDIARMNHDGSALEIFLDGATDADCQLEPYP